MRYSVSVTTYPGLYITKASVPLCDTIVSWWQSPVSARNCSQTGLQWIHHYQTTMRWTKNTCQITLTTSSPSDFLSFQHVQSFCDLMADIDELLTLEMFKRALQECPKTEARDWSKRTERWHDPAAMKLLLGLSAWSRFCTLCPQSPCKCW